MTDDQELFEKIHNNLKNGMVLKNYKELCAKLDIPEKFGNSKTAQISEIRKFCDLYKKSNSHKYKVRKIYKNPIEKDINPISNNTIYTILIENILLSYFIKENKTEHIFIKEKLWEILGMTNKNYIKFQYKGDLAKIEPVSEWDVKNAYQNSRSKLNSILTSSLNSLKRRKLIEYNEVIVGKKDDKFYIINFPSEIEKILKIEKDTLKKLKCNNIIQVIYSDKFNKYINIRNQKIEEEVGYSMIMRRIRIICNKEYLEQGLIENKEKLKKELNQKVLNSLIKQVENKYKNNINSNNEFKYHDSYVEAQKILLRKIIDINEVEIIVPETNYDDYEELFC